VVTAPTCAWVVVVVVVTAGGGGGDGTPTNPVVPGHAYVPREVIRGKTQSMGHNPEVKWKHTPVVMLVGLLVVHLVV